MLTGVMDRAMNYVEKTQQKKEMAVKVRRTVNLSDSEVTFGFTQWALGKPLADLRFDHEVHTFGKVISHGN